jgi:hypothetical protein
MNTAADVLIRLKTLFNVESDKALSVGLGVSTPTISAWRQRNSPPYELCVQIAQERGVDLNWLLTGEGEMMKREAQGNDLTPREAALLDNYRHVEDDRDKSLIERTAFLAAKADNEAAEKKRA